MLEAKGAGRSSIQDPLEPGDKTLIQCANPGLNGSVKKSLKEVKGRAEETWSLVLEGASNKG